jgi:WD40 repeat protein
MTYCINPKCNHPENSDQNRFCSYCGNRLWLGDRYRIIQSLSSLKVGRTFLAIDEEDPKKPRCIVKQIPLNSNPNKHPKEIEDFKKEALTLQELGHHPQIPKILAYFLPQKHLPHLVFPLLVQEFIEGQTISKEVFEEAEIRDLLDQVLPILQFVHTKGIIHRDINPSNIIRQSNLGSFNTKGKLFLVDFSTAKVTTKTVLANTGTVIGSGTYTAPEQLKGKATFASDLYSLGLTCIHLLTTIHPFDLFSTINGLAGWRDYLAEPFDRKLGKILDKMVAENLSQRYKTATEVLQDLHPGKTFDLPEFNPNSNLEFTLDWHCIKTFTGHINSIHALSFSPDGKYLASGSADQTITIWDLESFNQTKKLTGHQGIIESVLFTHQGNQIISASWDYKIKIWDVTTGENLRDLTGHTGWIKALALSADDQILASSGTDKTIKIWLLKTGEITHNLTEHQAAIHCLAISPNNLILASGSQDETIKIWSLKTGKMLLTLTGHSATVEALVFSPTGQILISASQDQSIKIWNLKTSQIIHTLNGHSQGINALALRSQGDLLISGSNDKTITIWHPGTGELLDTIFGHSSGIKAVAIHPKIRLLASGSQDKTIKIWKR